MGPYRRRKEKNHRKLNSLLLTEENRALSRGFKYIAGIDEAGRGPLAGPVVACSIILKDFDFSVRIDDSKRLTRVEREIAYQHIINKAFVGIGIIDEEIIDRINIYRATILAMEESLQNLNKVPDILLIDGNTRLRFKYPQVTIIHGDQKSLSIACASIVAKVTRDRLLCFYDTIFPGYGFGKHKGYGTTEHIMAMKDKGLAPIHRRTFKPTALCSRLKELTI
ncbi:MAG: ribonuclease HII [Candidatus Omnitrophota bacterium]